VGSGRGREAEHRRDARVGILLRTEVAEPGHHLDATAGETFRDAGRERGVDVGRRLAADHEHFGLHLTEARVGAVVRTHRVHASLDLRPALELEDAVAPVAQAVGAAGGSLVDARLGEPNLEDVFIHLTGRALR